MDGEFVLHIDNNNKNQIKQTEVKHQNITPGRTMESLDSAHTLMEKASAGVSIVFYVFDV